MIRGEIWWANLPLPKGSKPAKRRPVLIIQNDSFNLSGITDLTEQVAMLPKPMLEKMSDCLKLVLEIR